MRGGCRVHPNYSTTVGETLTGGIPVTIQGWNSETRNRILLGFGVLACGFGLFDLFIDEVSSGLKFISVGLLLLLTAAVGERRIRLLRSEVNARPGAILTRDDQRYVLISGVALMGIGLYVVVLGAIDFGAGRSGWGAIEIAIGAAPMLLATGALVSIVAIRRLESGRAGAFSRWWLARLKTDSQ